ncbi:MAG: hypothetical protein ABW189_03245 [Rickettsiales bacterium]
MTAPAAAKSAANDPRAYSYDTSSYVVLQMKVKRDPATGRLRQKEERSDAEKSAKRA